MAELVLGSLGVVPLVGVAIKSYQSLSSKLKTFRHCSSTVMRVHKKLRVRRRVFENECHLLLRDCLNDDAAVQLMMEDLDHEAWRERRRDDDLRRLLKDNYDECTELVQDIVGVVHQLETGLGCFEVVKSKQQKDERLKDTWKRLGDGLRISFNKSSYETGLDDLQTANNDLKCLREQITQLQKPCKDLAIKRLATGALGWTDVRRAAKALYEALVGTWSCSQASHIQHFVKLFLETEKADGDVKMNIAILSHGYGGSPGQADLIQLQVRSRHMEWAPYLRLPLLSPDSGEERPRKRMKPVRFNEDYPKPRSAKAPIQGQCLAQPPVDSQKATDMGPHCLGHIDVKSEECYRHVFFASSGSSCKGFRPSTMEGGELIPMDAVCETAGGMFSTVDRLQMARSLVSVVLKFHATPWLGEAWRLQDLSFFHQGGQDLTRSFRTLHLGVEFDQKNLRQMCVGSTMEGVQRTTSTNRLSQVSEDERLFCGIENMALHCLGVALLQIDRLKKMEPEDVLGVRKMARLSSSLGPRYQEITQKCLRCDFGYGTDLSKTQLQKAVYESVAGTLESMMSSLGIDDDS
ncbi:hypothetical protein DL770_009054 [Monosporascus sp. CRB-9-2]|nr:hypothetical protein DL770_009054 [Monosporascus sp. CRB-9-2]